MGSIYHALERAGNLQPIASAIKDVLTKKQQDEEMQNYLDLMRQSRIDVDRIYNPVDTNNNVPSPDPSQVNTSPTPQNTSPTPQNTPSAFMQDGRRSDGRNQIIDPSRTQINPNQIQGSPVASMQDLMNRTPQQPITAPTQIQGVTNTEVPPVTAPAPNIAPQKFNALGDGSTVPGMVQQGNVDLTNRPNVPIPGTNQYASVRSKSFNFDGKEVLLPTVSDDGRLLSDQEAIQQYKQTGKNLGVFDTPENATDYAQKLHLQQQNLGQKQSSPATLGNSPMQQLTGKAPLTIDQQNKAATLRLIKTMSDLQQYQTVDPNLKNQGLSMLQMLIQNNQPKQPIYRNAKSGEVIQKSLDNGNTWITDMDNSKDDTKSDKALREITDANGHPYQSFIRPDSSTYLKDMATNKILTPEESAKLEFKDPNGSGNSLGWAIYNLRVKEYSQNEQEKKEAKNEKLSKTQEDNQNAYNDIMGAPRLSKQDLIDQGLVNTTDQSKTNYVNPNSFGGAYVVREKSGPPKVFFNDAELENYAKNKVSKAPNKWNRTQTPPPPKSTGQKFEEGKTYIDDNGQKAIYRNGKYEEVK